MENTNTIHFRKSGDGLISVTEQNTKITYTKDHEYTIGRIVISFTRVAVRKTLQARWAYFMHNNCIARFKRGFMHAVSRFFLRFGIHVYMTY